MALVVGNLDALAKQFSDVLEQLLQSSNKLLVDYQNRLAKDTFDVDRFFIAEEIGSAVANGSIDLTRRFSQATLIEGIIVNIDPNLSATLIVDRYSRVISNTQSRENIIAPIRHIAGPGKILKLTWTTAMTQPPYFAAYGTIIGSAFAS